MMPYDAIVGVDVLSKGTVIIEKGVCHVLPINISCVDVDQDLPEESNERLHKTLQQYSHCFGENMNELGKSRTFKMDIRLTSNTTVARKPYPISIPKQKTVERIVAELLELSIITRSRSAYSSPIVIVPKQNGEDRLCIDYRELNSITEKQPWHMPTVDGVLATLAGNSFFTTLDMMSGYYQLEMNDTSREYTAFVTHHGHFEFKRMPFGLRNAPAAFQRMMAQLIEPLGSTVTSYVDEIIIATPTIEAGIDVLINFLKLVQNEGLTLRLSKCSFLKRSVSFLGHVIDANGIRPGENKTLAIKRYPTPCSQQEVRRFLGLVGFFRKFVQHFALIAKPLSSLLKKDAKFMWSNECEAAFRRLATILSESPVLMCYDVNKNHQVHTDASSAGVAAILLQDEGGAYKPVAYLSRACNAAEQKYHSYELEVLAVVQACERFRTYLLGKPFTIVTDYRAISSAKINKPMVPRVSRWFLKLLEYDYTIIHRNGENMKHVDALSRAPVGDNDSSHESCAAVMGINIQDWVTILQQQDPKLKFNMDVLAGLQQSEQEKQIKNKFCLKQHRLFKRMGDDKTVLVVPKGLRWRIAKLFHDDIGHPGVDGTLKCILENFWFPLMRNFIKNYVNSCIDCSYHREPQRKEAELYGMEIPRLPFQVLHMDHLGPFCKSRRGNEYILVIVDALKRYVIIVPVKSTKIKPVLHSLNQLTLVFGLPQKIISDRGTAFTSGSFENYCVELNIQHIQVAVRTQRANGLAERVNQTVLQYLKPATQNERDWDCELRQLQWTLNTKVNATTKMTAIELVYDFPLRDISGNKLLTALQDETHVNMNNRREEAIQNINIARDKWKKRFNDKHRTPMKYREGEMVLLESPAPATGQSRKLLPVYKGPYEIKKVLRFDRYVVEGIDGLRKSRRKFSTVATAEKLKPWCALVPEIDDDFDDSLADEDEG